MPGSNSLIYFAPFHDLDVVSEVVSEVPGSGLSGRPKATCQVAGSRGQAGSPQALTIH